MLKIFDMLFFITLSFIITGFFNDDKLPILLQQLSAIVMVGLIVTRGFIDCDEMMKGKIS